MQKNKVFLDTIFKALRLYWYVPKTSAFYYLISLIGITPLNSVIFWLTVIMDLAALISGYM